MSEKNQRIARYSFNITGIPEIERLELGDRQEELARKKPSIALRTSQLALKTDILPNFAEQLLARRWTRKWMPIAGNIAAAIILVAVTVIVTLGIDGKRAESGASTSPSGTSATGVQDPNMRVCHDIFTSADFTEFVSPVPPDALHWGNPETFDQSNCTYELDAGSFRTQLKIQLFCGSAAQSELSKFQTRPNRRASSEVPKALMYNDAIAILTDGGTFIEADYWLTSPLDSSKQHFEVDPVNLEHIIRRLTENESKRHFC